MTKPVPSHIRPPPTATTLAAAALRYLARYAASEASLRRVLQGKIRRAAQQHDDFAADRDRQAELQLEIDRLIEKHRASGALNDAAFAEIKVRGLRQRGRSRRMISQKLATQGIDDDVVKQALVAFDDDRSPEAVEMEAATALARRRKLGPYRTAELTDAAAWMKARQKDFGAMARAGFSMGVARRVLGGEAFEFDDDADGEIG